jgi:Ca2+-binding RTX toxin-like protein
MAECSAQEQLMLELVNRARMDPLGEAARYGIDLNDGLAPGTISATPKQVLAMNDFLVIAADRHSDWMLINDQFDHQEAANFPAGRTGLSFSDRIAAARYGPLTTGGENIAFIGQSGAIDATTAIFDEHKGLFLSEGHRVNLLNDTFSEAGIGQQIGLFTQNGITYNASLVTQDFAFRYFTTLSSGPRFFVTGVVYNDTVINDNFFSVGEQLAGRAVNSGSTSDTTGAGGGYELGFHWGGAYTIDFHVSASIDIRVTVQVGSNVKVDVVNGHEVWTNAALTVTAGPVTEIHALGINGLSLTGSAAGERLFGTVGHDTLRGGGGNDSLDGGASSDHMFGQVGSDLYMVDDAGDIVDESFGSGTDTVHSAVSFNLGDTHDAVGGVENLVLIGNKAVNADGNGLNNAIIGNPGPNKISGGLGSDTLNGGDFHDRLTGGGGADSFVFTSAAVAANSDTIADFHHVDDTIRLQNAVMTSLHTTGTLAAANFFNGAQAHDANDYIIYNPSTGGLYYDSDGTGAHAQVLLATISNRPADLAAADFLVI